MILTYIAYYLIFNGIIFYIGLFFQEYKIHDFYPYEINEEGVYFTLMLGILLLII